MSKKIVEHCPVCGSDMFISKISCRKCDIEITGDFGDVIESKNEFQSQLNSDDFSFIQAFLKDEGNISKLQETLGLGYTAIKTRLKQINTKLGKGSTMETPDLVKYIETASSDDSASAFIKDSLSKVDGVAEIPMLRGEPLKIWMTIEGVRNSGFPDLLCEWKIFDAIHKKAVELGGTMYRGDSAAQNGFKIGSKELPLDTIDAFISTEFYGKQVGDSTLRRSTYYSAIMAWAGICLNHRSDGAGGYIQLVNEWNC